MNVTFIVRGALVSARQLRDSHFREDTSSSSTVTSEEGTTKKVSRFLILCQNFCIFLKPFWFSGDGNETY